MSFFNLPLVTLERCQVPPLSELRVPQLSQQRIPPLYEQSICPTNCINTG